jgi:hypothetical protein
LVINVGLLLEKRKLKQKVKQLKQLSWPTEGSHFTVKTPAKVKAKTRSKTKQQNNKTTKKLKNKNRKIEKWKNKKTKGACASNHGLRGRYILRAY